MVDSTDDSTGPGRYRFGDIVVDPAAHTLLRAGEPRAVEPKSFAVLLALLQRPGELVARDELLDRVWGHRHVTPGVLTRAIAQLRAALGDDPQQPRYIQTRHALGYCFVGELQDDSRAADAPGAPSEPTPGIDDLREDAAGPPPAVGDGRTDADALDHPHARRARHGLLASLLAIAMLAFLAYQQIRKPATPTEASIAVMPFANLGGGNEQDYFAEGLAIEMHDALAGVSGLKVAAPMSASASGRGEADVRELGRRLGVAAVLDASVRREGQRVRISARLADTATGYTLWNRTYDRELSDVFAIQSEIANEVVQSLVGMIPGQRRALEKRLTPTQSVAAFDAYLRGLGALLAAGRKHDDAVAHFEQALAGDRRFARAQAGICRAEVAALIDRNDSGAYDRASAACALASEMDPDLTEVLLARGDLHLVRGEHATAMEYYEKARSDPASRVAAYAGMAKAHASMGEDERSRDYFNRALALRPDDARIHMQAGYHAYFAGRIEDAVSAYRRAAELQPDDAVGWSYLGAIYQIAGRLDDAATALSRSLEIERTPSALTNLGELRYFEGNYIEAASLHHEAAMLDRNDYLLWGNLGQALLAIPERATEARDAFAEAARLAARYIELRPDDAKALAALAWYRVNLAERGQAVRDLMRRAVELGGEPAEVALFNAQSLTALGATDAARAQMRDAMSSGMAGYRIRNNAALADAGGQSIGGIDEERAPSARDAERRTAGE